MKNFIKILILICLVIGITACGKPKVEDIKAKMETHLQEKYGESFVVENIRMRDANGQKFYTARIYPKAIVGTPKELDDYYYATVNIDILSNGKLRKTGDTYGEVNTREEAEKYLLPKAKVLFGERIRLKTEPELQEKDDKNGLWYGYITPHFQDGRDKAKNNPEKYRLKMTLYLYVFDKIDREKEKKERRTQLFEFLQYLRAEKLDKYLEVFMVFTDDIILAPSFEEKRYDLENDLENRKEIEKSLREEVKNMSEDNYIKAIENIRKKDISVSDDDELYVYNKSDFLILTMEMLKIDMYGRYDEAKENNTVEKHNYKNASDIEFSYWDSYLFKEGE